MSDDVRDRLRRGDVLARSGKYAEAIPVYQSVAEDFQRSGLDLKAAGVSIQVVRLVENFAPELTAERFHALRRLVDLYTNLGLPDEADQIREKLQTEDAV